MRGYLIYIVIVAVFALPILISPFLAESQPAFFESVQWAYAPTCHQLTSRSLCYFPAKMSIEDCLPTPEFNATKTKVVEKAGAAGYKFPVCARDVGIYLFMLIGGVAFAFVRKLDDKSVPPAIWFIIALVPIGIDGGGQFIGLWESTNTIRIVSGAIAGFAIPFYVIPMLNGFLDKKTGKK